MSHIMTLDLFAAVVATNTPNLSCLYTLTIQAPSSWMFVPSISLPHPGAQRVVDPLPISAVTPHSKVVVDAFPLRILSGQHPPLDTSHHYVEDGIDHHSHIQATRSSARLWRRNQFSDNIPLAVGQIGWV